MRRGVRGTAVRDLGLLYDSGAVAGLDDRQLLDRFLRRNGEAAELAFAALVERHGPMVFRACRAVLRDPDDARDAFQATFLVLARKAGGLWVGDSLGPWLHRVARKTALCARAASARRRRHERAAAAGFEAARPDPPPDDLAAVLDEELLRLPEPYRSAVVLCCLEGLSQEQAAGRLGCPVGTVQSRLARGKRRLRERLTRRGIAPAVAALAVDRAARAAPAVGLASEAVARAAARIAAGGCAAGAVPAAVSVLAGEVARMMMLSKLKWAGVLVLGVGLAGAGSGVLGQGPAKPGDQASLPPGEKAVSAREGSERMEMPLPPGSRISVRITRPDGGVVEFDGVAGAETLDLQIRTEDLVNEAGDRRIATYRGAAGQLAFRSGGAAGPGGLTWSGTILPALITENMVGAAESGLHGRLRTTDAARSVSAAQTQERTPLARERTVDVTEGAGPTRARSVETTRRSPDAETRYTPRGTVPDDPFAAQHLDLDDDGLADFPVRSTSPRGDDSRARTGPVAPMREVRAGDADTDARLRSVEEKVDRLLKAWESSGPAPAGGQRAGRPAATSPFEDTDRMIPGLKELREGQPSDRKGQAPAPRSDAQTPQEAFSKWLGAFW